MNVTLTTATAAARPAAAHPRVRYLDPLGLDSPADFSAALGRAASLGFESVLVPPPWAPGASGDRFAPASLDKVHPVLGGGAGDAWVRGYVQGLPGAWPAPDARPAAGLARCRIRR